MPHPDFIQNTRRSVEIPPPPSPTLEAAPPGVSPAQRTLSFDIEQSQRTNWCWAAVAVSVSHFYSPTSSWNQCKLANQVLGTKCCGNSNPDVCNRQRPLRPPLEIVGHFGTRIVGEIEPLRLQSEIDGNRPVACRIEWYWSGGRGHFVVLNGYHHRSNGQWWVRVRDPSTTRRSYPIRKFATAYRDGAGKWTHTYTTKP